MGNIEKLFNWISLLIGIAGGVLAHYMGGWDRLLRTILFLAVCDYVTGCIKAIYMKNASGMKYAKIREIRNQLERCRYVVMSAEAKIKRVEPLSQKFEQTVQLIQDTKEQVNNLVWQELRCKEELRAEEQQERKQDPQWVNE